MQYTKEDALQWLHKLDNYIREYADKVSPLPDDNLILSNYYTLKLKRACDELEIPEATLS